MSDPSYDENTTYLVFTPDNISPGFETVEDLCGNVYNLNNTFPYNATSNPFYTYSNNSENLNNIQFEMTENLPVPPFNNNFTKVILGKNVTIINENAFNLCEQLSSVTIPNSVTSIGDNAFCGCNLNSVIIPDSVTSIGEFAFYGNYPLTTISVGNSVSSIGSYAFMYIALNSPNDLTLNYGTNEYVYNYFYTNITNNGYNNSSYTVNVTYNPPYQTTVEATYTLTSSGTDPTGNGASSTFAVGGTESTGNVVTASSTFTASASGINKEDAIKSLIKHVNEKFVSPKVIEFSSKYRNDSHNLTFTHK